MTFAYELHRLADQVADLEIETRELKHEVFTLKNDNDQLRKSLEESRPPATRTADGMIASGVPENHAESRPNQRGELRATSACRPTF